jgi:hypothetical protein
MYRRHKELFFLRLGFILNDFIFFNQFVDIPAGFFQVLNAILLAPAPQIFDGISDTNSIKAFQINCSRRQCVDALNTALGLVLGMVYIVSHYLCPLIHFSCLAAVPAVAKFFKLACRFASSNLYCSVFHSLNALQIAWQPIFLTSHPLQGDLPTIFSCSPLPLPVCRLYAPALQSLLYRRS